MRVAYNLQPKSLVQRVAFLFEEELEDLNEFFALGMVEASADIFAIADIHVLGMPGALVKVFLGNHGRREHAAEAVEDIRHANFVEIELRQIGLLLGFQTAALDEFLQGTGYHFSELYDG